MIAVKKKFLLFLLLFTFPLQGDPLPEPQCLQPKLEIKQPKKRKSWFKKKSKKETPSSHTSRQTHRWYFAVKPGYFYPTDEVVRKIFHHGGFSMRGEIDWEMWKTLALWLDGGCFWKSGHAIGGSEKNSMQVGSATVGLKGFWFPHPRAGFYAGLGPRLFILKVQNHSSFVKKHETKVGLGGGFTAGFLVFHPQDHLFLDLFLDYSVKEIEGHPNGIASKVHDINLDGLTAGVGIGWRL